MRIAIINFLLLLCVSSTGFSAQIPLFSAFNLNPQFYNPAYTAFQSSYEFGYIGGYGSKGVEGYQSFCLQNRSTKQIIEGSKIFDRPNYSNIAIAIPIKLKKDNGIGLGFSFTNNDIQRLETFNTMGFSAAYNWHEKIGRFSLGLTGKRIVASATDKRIYYSFAPETQAIFNTYKGKEGNWDIGMMYSNDSGTFDIGLSVCDNSASTLGVKSLDEKYALNFESGPNVVAISNFQLKINQVLNSKNNFIAVTNNGFKASNFLVRSQIVYKSVGLGIQYVYNFNQAIGPCLSLSNNNMEALYSVKFGMAGGMGLALHEIGIKARFNSLFAGK